MNRTLQVLIYCPEGLPCERLEIFLTFPSGSSTYPSMSVSAVFPNLPKAPCSFRPVKVRAIFQNLTIQTSKLPLQQLLYSQGCPPPPTARMSYFHM